jgi:hypothetical protein
MKHNFRGKNFLIVGIGLLAFQTSDRAGVLLQAKEKGWTVKKGSKATTIFFAMNLTVKDAEGGRRRAGGQDRQDVFPSCLG